MQFASNTPALQLPGCFLPGVVSSPPSRRSRQGRKRPPGRPPQGDCGDVSDSLWLRLSHKKHEDVARKKTRHEAGFQKSTGIERVQAGA
jgi:hypothetical protein